MTLQIENIPIFGLGHSMGSLIQLLIGNMIKVIKYSLYSIKLED